MAESGKDSKPRAWTLRTSVWANRIFLTPAHIKKAAIRAIEENLTKYTSIAGIMPLREAICAWHKRELGSGYSAKECIVNVGGKHAIFNALSVLVQQGDEVILPAPVLGELSGHDYVCWREPGVCAGAPGRWIQRKSRRDQKKAITPKTKMMIINSPSNPAGGGDSSR